MLLPDLVDMCLTLDAAIARQLRLSLMADIVEVEQTIDTFRKFHTSAYDTLLEQLANDGIELGTLAAYKSKHFTCYNAVRNELNKSLNKLQTTLNSLYAQLGIKV